METEVAKCLHQLEMEKNNLKEFLGQIFLNSAVFEEYEQQDGSLSKTLLIKIPFRSMQAFQKVSESVIEHLEKKFSYPVIVVGNRTIISTRGNHL